MKTRVGFCFFLLLALLRIVLEHSPAFGAEPQWVEVHSPHFSIVTDAGEKRGRETALRFEQMREVFATLLTRANVDLGVPLQVVAFRNSSEVEQFAPIWNGEPTRIAGLFQGSSDHAFIILDMSTANPWKVVFHEYAHQLLSGNLYGRAGAWFEEGFAEYFSSVEVDGKHAKVGKIPDSDYASLQHRGMIKVSELFQVTHSSRIYNDTSDRRTVFYVESSMLVHYLYDNSLLNQLWNYLRLITDKRISVEDAIQQAFGMTSQQFDQALKAYISNRVSRYSTISIPDFVSSRDLTSAPLTSADADAVLADVHLHSPYYREKALPEFQEILQTNPNHAGALRGIGYAYLQQHDFDRAEQNLRRAEQANPKDPRVHFYRALVMERQGKVSKNRAELEEVKEELQSAIELDPAFSEPYSLLSLVYATGGEIDKALTTIRKAVELSPRNEQYLYNLAMVHLSAQDLDSALALLTALVNSATPEVAERAKEALAEAESYKSVLGSTRQSVASWPPSLGKFFVFDHLASPRAQNAELAVESTSPLVESSKKLRRPRFLKGQLTSVDCSAPPLALLTVISENRTWKLTVSDMNHLILIGADTFSCAWKNQKVAVNYFESSAGEGNVVSVEIQ